MAVDSCSGGTVGGVCCELEAELVTAALGVRGVVSGLARGCVVFSFTSSGTGASSLRWILLCTCSVGGAN